MNNRRSTKHIGMHYKKLAIKKKQKDGKPYAPQDARVKANGWNTSEARKRNISMLKANAKLEREKQAAISKIVIPLERPTLSWEFDEEDSYEDVIRLMEDNSNTLGKYFDKVLCAVKSNVALYKIKEISTSLKEGYSNSKKYNSPIEVKRIIVSGALVYDDFICEKLLRSIHNCLGYDGSSVKSHSAYQIHVGGIIGDRAFRSIFKLQEIDKKGALASFKLILSVVQQINQTQYYKYQMISPLWTFHIVHYDHTSENTGQHNGINTLWNRAIEYYYNYCKNNRTVYLFDIDEKGTTMEEIIKFGVSIYNTFIPRFIPHFFGIGCVDHLTDLLMKNFEKRRLSLVAPFPEFRTFQRELFVFLSSNEFKKYCATKNIACPTFAALSDIRYISFQNFSCTLWSNIFLVQSFCLFRNFKIKDIFFTLLQFENIVCIRQKIFMKEAAKVCTINEYALMMKKHYDYFSSNGISKEFAGEKTEYVSNLCVAFAENTKALFLKHCPCLTSTGDINPIYLNDIKISGATTRTIESDFGKWKSEKRKNNPKSTLLAESIIKIKSSITKRDDFTSFSSLSDEDIKFYKSKARSLLNDNPSHEALLASRLEKDLASDECLKTSAHCAFFASVGFQFDGVYPSTLSVKDYREYLRALKPLYIEEAIEPDNMQKQEIIELVDCLIAIHAPNAL